MKAIRLATLIFAGALAFAAIGCSGDAAKEDNAATENSNQGAASTESPGEIKLDDGSTLTVSQLPDGTRTEVWTFESGEVARVTRTTPTSGKSTATVEFRDDRKVEVEDESFVERAMDATGDAIATTANNIWETSKDVGGAVGEKSGSVAEKVADTSVDVGKAVGKGAKTGAKATAKGAKTGAKATAKGAKEVGKGVKKLGEKIKP